MNNGGFGCFFFFPPVPDRAFSHTELSTVLKECVHELEEAVLRTG